MNIEWKKVAIVGIPVVVMIAAIYIWYKVASQPKQVYVGANTPTVPPKVVSTTTPQAKAAAAAAAPSGGYPLQQGSNNATVKQLQAILGVTADGIFGPATLAALQNQFGLNSVPDAGTLAQIQNAGPLTTQAQSTNSIFAQGGSDLYFTQDYFVNALNSSDPSNPQYTGTGFQANAGQTYDGTVYTLDGGVTALGLCTMFINAGPLQGEYVVDPTVFLLKPHTTALSVTPVTDSSGITTFQV